MLRPACLLPSKQLTPLFRLLTPRSDGQVSPLRPGSATRRSDAYRLGTCTRWTGAAGNSHPSPLRVQFLYCFTTHHAGIIVSLETIMQHRSTATCPPVIQADARQVLSLRKTHPAPAPSATSAGQTPAGGSPVPCAGTGHRRPCRAPAPSGAPARARRSCAGSWPAPP